MKPRRAVVIAVGIAVIALWWLPRERAAISPASERAAERHAGGSKIRSAWRESRNEPRGSISGTVTDDAKAPIARAQVCISTVGPLTDAPPGTRFTLGTQRGFTATVVLAPPPGAPAR
jgi:hypothetical protein